MNLKKCERQHYYNGDKFAACPYCSAKGKKAEITWKIKRIEDEPPKKELKDAVFNAYEQKRRAMFACQELQKEGDALHPFGVLVVSDGAQKGEIFPLYLDRENYACYEDGSFRIIHQKTQDVYASFHANPDHRSFYISMEAEPGAVMVGRVVVTGAVPIEAYDNLQIAACNVMFVPICGSHFWW